LSDDEAVLSGGQASLFGDQPSLSGDQPGLSGDSAVLFAHLPASARRNSPCSAKSHKKGLAKAIEA
jgi:hypothetical protein